MKIRRFLREPALPPAIFKNNDNDSDTTTVETTKTTPSPLKKRVITTSQGD